MPPPVQPPMQGMVDPPHPMSSPGMPGSFGMKDFGKTDPFGPDPQGMGSVAMGSPGDAAVKAGKPAPSRQCFKLAPAAAMATHFAFTPPT